MKSRIHPVISIEGRKAGAPHCEISMVLKTSLTEHFERKASRRGELLHRVHRGSGSTAAIRPVFSPGMLFAPGIMHGTFGDVRASGWSRWLMRPAVEDVARAALLSMILSLRRNNHAWRRQNRAKRIRPYDGKGTRLVLRSTAWRAVFHRLRKNRRIRFWPGKRMEKSLLCDGGARMGRPTARREPGNGSRLPAPEQRSG
jgi:hypothetical protein